MISKNKLSLAVAAVISMTSLVSEAAIFTVTKTEDTDRSGCIVGDCSYREALKVAADNGVLERDEIRFNIPGSGPYTITITPTLPPLPALANVTIDGSTSASPIILDGHLMPTGASSGAISAVRLSGNSKIKSMRIESFGGIAKGIFITGGDNVVEGCTITHNGIGILLVNSMGDRIGGALAGQGNLITQNRSKGIWITDSSNSEIVGNDIRGSTQGEGVYISGAASFGNHIGGAAPGEGNIIASNELDGIALLGAGHANSILGNSIYGNGGLGIDLGNNGPDTNDDNDLDSTGTDNGLQNYPVISSVQTNGCETQIQWSFKSQPSLPGYSFEFFLNDAMLQPADVEAQSPLGSVFWSVNIFPAEIVTHSFTVPVRVGEYVTGTATAPDGSTSEISAPVAAVAVVDRGLLNFSQSAVSVSESAGSLPIQILRTCGSSEAVTVTVTSANGTASAGSDYTAVSEQVTFAAGDTEKTISLPILNDATPESEELFTVTLSNSTPGLDIGTIPQVTVNIADDDSPSGNLPGNPGTAEGPPSGGCSLIRR